MRLLIAFFLITYSVFAAAGPGPFGFQIDKSKYENIKTRYALTFTETLDVANITYTAYTIDVKALDLKGLHNGTLYFEKKTGLLKCVLLNVDAGRYAAFQDILAEKYRTIDRTRNVLNDKYAIFEKDNTIIKLDAPVLSRLMRLIYINKDIYNTLNRDDTKKQKQQQKKEEAKKL